MASLSTTPADASPAGDPAGGPWIELPYPDEPCGLLVTPRLIAHVTSPGWGRPAVAGRLRAARECGVTRMRAHVDQEEWAYIVRTDDGRIAPAQPLDADPAENVVRLVVPGLSAAPLPIPFWACAGVSPVRVARVVDPLDRDGDPWWFSALAADCRRRGEPLPGRSRPPRAGAARRRDTAAWALPMPRLAVA